MSSVAFAMQNMHIFSIFITPITRHYYANNLPSTEQAAKTQPKQENILSLSLIFQFLTVYLLFKYRFVS